MNIFALKKSQNVCSWLEQQVWTTWISYLREKFRYEKIGECNNLKSFKHATWDQMCSYSLHWNMHRLLQLTKCPKVGVSLWPWPWHIYCTPILTANRKKQLVSSIWLNQTQHGGETEHIISGRNALCAGGVGRDFSMWNSIKKTGEKWE